MPAKDKQEASKGLWIKNGSGRSSVSVTLLSVSFIATTFAYVASIFERIGPLSVRTFDAGACSAYFIPILTLYFGRKYTEAKFRTSSDESATTEGTGK